MKLPQRILFFKLGAMGDLLMTTPLLRQVRQNFPTAQIDYLTASGFETVLSANPHLDQVVTFNPTIFTSKNILAFYRLALRLRPTAYDLIFVLDKHWSFALVAWLAGIPRRVGFHRDKLAHLFLSHGVPYGPIRHEVQYYLDLLAEIGSVNRTDLSMELPLPAPPTSSPQTMPHDYVVCINSGGHNLRENTSLRRLPARLFVNLLEILQSHTPVVLLGSRDDRLHYQSLALPAGVINLAGETTLFETLHLMQNARHIFTTDNGAMHLAGTTATPMTIFFGPSHPLRKAPLRAGIVNIWLDEDHYDDRYETFGHQPAGHEYFNKLDLQKIALPFQSPSAKL